MQRQEEGPPALPFLGHLSHHPTLPPAEIKARQNNGDGAQARSRTSFFPDIHRDIPAPAIVDPRRRARFAVPKPAPQASAAALQDPTPTTVVTWRHVRGAYATPRAAMVAILPRAIDAACIVDQWPQNCRPSPSLEDFSLEAPAGETSGRRFTSSVATAWLSAPAAKKVKGDAEAESGEEPLDLRSMREHTHGEDDCCWGGVFQVWGLGLFLKLQGVFQMLVASPPRRCGMAFWLPKIRGQGMAAKGA
jgi:hypothetical protein